MNKIHCCVVLCHPSAAINKRRRLCYNLTPRPSETVRLPWKVHERETVYRQLSAQPPHRLSPLKKNLNHFCLDCHSVCDNVYCLLTMFSARVV